MNISINNTIALTMILTQNSEPLDTTIHYLVIGKSDDGAKIHKVIEKTVAVPSFTNERQRLAFAAQIKDEVKKDFEKKGGVVTVYSMSKKTIT